MGKKCVLWAKPVLASLTVIIAATTQWSGGALSAQSSDPLQLPRLAFADLIYMGGFRMPRPIYGNDSFSYGGQHLAYNPARNSLFGSSLSNNVAEVSIPTPVKTSDVNQMPFATFLQPFSDPSEGHFREVEQGGPNPAVMAGLLVHGNRLYATGSIYYDAMNSQVVTHFSHATNLSEPSFSGMSQVWETGKAGFVGGYMTNIPSEWQSLLGGPALTGQCCIPIVTRTSYGPGAFSFDPTRVAGGASVPATPLLYYTHEHATLGPWEGANPAYGATTAMGGVALINGTRTALFIGRNGSGTYCYGHGVTDKSLEGTRAADGQLNCYDPASSDKGMHAYPYRYQIWAYDLADFAAVKAGAKQPWEVVPYGIWPLDLPTPERTVRIGGVAYDAQRQLLYISQYRADTDGYSERPIIHTMKINAPGAGGSPLPAPAPDPAPSPMAVSATANGTAPKMVGSSITWTASATGGRAPYEYKWFASAGGVTTLLRDWSASQTFVWRPTTGGRDMRVIVWARSSGNTSDAFEAKAEYPFAISEIAIDSVANVVSAPVTSLGLQASLSSPQPAGTSIVWTATPAGGSGALVYKWFVSSDGASWNTMGSWTASNQFSWTPTAAGANYRVAVWVKRASNPKEEWEATAERTFAIAEAAAQSSPVATVSLTTNLASPQPAGSAIVWTATPAGGSGALVYKWFVSNDGASWSTNGLWASSNQFTWTPAVQNANYRVSVWVKRASNPKDEWEATAQRQFAVTEASVPVGGVALTTNVPSPQPAGATIVWTATAAGGSGTLVYKWFVSRDGASWNTNGLWTPSNQFTWTPATESANYRVSVWVKRASNPKEEWEATSAQPFVVTEPSFPVASVAVTANVPSPQPAGSTIVWTATPTGGTGPLVYKWFVSNDGASWITNGLWTSSNQFVWTPAIPGANYRVSAWVKRAGNPKDEWEASSQQSFAVTEPSFPVSSVALTSDVPAPQELSSTIVWTATPVGGTGPLVYKWFVAEDGSTWTAVTSWTLSNQLTWTPAVAGGNYRVAVWVKRASNPAEAAEALADLPFAIYTPVAAVAVTTDLPSPQPLPAAIEWTATPAADSGDPLVYRWFVSNDDGVTWVAAGPWNTSNRFTWTPNAVTSKYRVAVWVKHAANPSDFPEASSQRRFAIRK